MQTFKPDEMRVAMGDGWFISPEDAYLISDVPLDLDGMSNKQVRRMAKDVGIDNWKKARIETLKAELANDHR